MPFRLEFTKRAKTDLKRLDSDLQKKKRVQRCLGLLETNPRHPGLQSHKFASIKGENGEDVFESYVENRTPAAWRVFWHYGPGNDQITIVAITPHP